METQKFGGTMGKAGFPNNHTSAGSEVPATLLSTLHVYISRLVGNQPRVLRSTGGPLFISQK